MSEPLYLLGLKGLAGAGKDETFKRVRARIEDRPVVRVSFADVLRRELEEVLGLPEGNNVLWRKPYSESLRWILQHYGTEYRRAQDEFYWTDRAAEWIQDIRHEMPSALVVITDVRFLNEAEMIRESGGVVAEVFAPSAVRRERLGGTLPPAHASEDQSFEPDFFIENYRVPVVPADLAVRFGLSPESLYLR